MPLYSSACIDIGPEAQSRTIGAIGHWFYYYTFPDHVPGSTAICRYQVHRVLWEQHPIAGRPSQRAELVHEDFPEIPYLTRGALSACGMYLYAVKPEQTTHEENTSAQRSSNAEILKVQLVVVGRYPMQGKMVNIHPNSAIQRFHIAGAKWDNPQLRLHHPHPEPPLLFLLANEGHYDDEDYAIVINDARWPRHVNTTRVFRARLDKGGEVVGVEELTQDFPPLPTKLEELVSKQISGCFGMLLQASQTIEEEKL